MIAVVAVVVVAPPLVEPRRLRGDANPPAQSGARKTVTELSATTASNADTTTSRFPGPNAPAHKARTRDPMRSPRPAPRAYLTNPDHFGRTDRPNWRVPTNGSNPDMRTARIQHDVSTTLRTLSRHGILTALAAHGNHDRRRWSAWTKGTRWMPPDAYAEVITWLTAQLRAADSAGDAAPIEVNPDCSQATLTPSADTSTSNDRQPSDDVRASPDRVEALPPVAMPAGPTLAQLIGLAGLDEVDGPLQTLPVLRAVQAAVHANIRVHAVAARQRGASWTQIGAALGVSRQAAQQAYGRLTKEARKGVPNQPDVSPAATTRAVPTQESRTAGDPAKTELLGHWRGLELRIALRFKGRARRRRT